MCTSAHDRSSNVARNSDLARAQRSTRGSFCHSRTQLLQLPRVGEPLTRTGWVLRSPTVLAPASPSRLGVGLPDRTALRQRHRDPVY